MGPTKRNWQLLAHGTIEPRFDEAHIYEFFPWKLSRRCPAGFCQSTAGSTTTGRNGKRVLIWAVA
jgi:hypothetical protein